MEAMEQTLVKPKPSAAGHYRYQDVIQYLENRYGFDSENASESETHFEKWADAKGYTEKKKDPQGRHRRSSQIWYQEYQDDPEGAACRPKTRSFRLWLYWLGGAFLKRDVPDKPLTLNLELLLGHWDDTVAPVMGEVVSLCRRRITSQVEAIMDAEGLPAEYRARILRDALSEVPVDARIPAFVRPILEYFRQEFGERLVVIFED
jgi:hypothetical protein